jgi:hypothetical protein
MRVASLASIAYSEGPIAVNDNAKPILSDDVGAKLLFMVGEMQGTMNALREDYQEIKGALEQDRHDATASRRRIYERLEDGDRRLTKMESTVRVVGELVDKQAKDIANTGAEIKALTPTVLATAATVRNWTIRGGALLGALALVGGGLWYLVTTYGVALWRFFDQFIPK